MIKKEYELLLPFIAEPWKRLTFREVKKLTNKTSESYVYNRLKNYVKEGILIEEKAGNVILYSLNLSEPKTQVFVGFISEYNSWNMKHIPFDELKKISSKIPANFFSLIITGSYVRKKQTKKSDIDIVILVENEPEKVYAELTHLCEMSIPQIHLYVFKTKDFLDMLFDNNANYGKEIVKNNLILHGGEAYFRIINEAISNGFNSKDIS